MTREEAKTDILAAINSGDLGDTVVINSVPLRALQRSLSAEENQQFATAGLAVEGIRLSLDATALGWQPAIGSELEIDGTPYRVSTSRRSGNLLKLTLTKNSG